MLTFTAGTAPTGNVLDKIRTNAMPIQKYNYRHAVSHDNRILLISIQKQKFLHHSASNYCHIT